MNRNILLASVAIGGMLVANPVLARDAATNAHSGKSGKQTIVVVGKRILPTQAIPLKSPYTVSTISQGLLRNASPGPDTSVQTLLNQVPSVQAVTSGPAGMRTNITFRAFNDGQFGQTFDGIVLNDSFNAGTSNAASNRNNTLLIPQNLDGIEVYRGINNPAVNTYNSLGGTINYIPRSPGSKTSAEVGVSAGSFNTQSYFGTLNLGSMDGFKNLVAARYDTSDGWIHNTGDHNVNIYYAGEKDLGNLSRINAYFIYNHNTGYTPHSMPLDLINGQGDPGVYSFDQGYYTQWPKDWSNSYNRDTSWLGILQYTRERSHHFAFNMKLYASGNDYKRLSYEDPSRSAGQVQPSGGTQTYYLPNQAAGYAFWTTYPIPVTYDPAAMFGSNQQGNKYHFYGYRRTTIGGQAKASFYLPHNTISIGGDASSSNLYSREYWYGTANMPMKVGYNDAWDEHDSRLLASAYVQDDIHLWNNRVHIVPGVKYLYAHTEDSDNLGFYYPNPGTVADDEHYTSPTIGASIEPVSGLVFHAAFGQNIKFPDISAYYNAFQQDNNGNFVIAPVTVKPEHVNDYELGVRLRRNGFTAAFNYYREDFKDIFVTTTDQTSGISTTQNGGSARYQGEELMLTADLGQLPVGSLNGYFNYAHNQAIYTSDANISDTGAGATFMAGQHVPNVPQDMAEAGVVWNYADWRVNVQGRYVGTRYIGAGYSGAPLASGATIPTYFTADLGIAKTIPLPNMAVKAVKISFNFNNIFDKHYYARETTDYGSNGTYFKALVGEGRAIFGSVKLYF